MRLEVSDGGAETHVDLAWDARMLPAVDTDLGPVLHEEELAADKVLALFGRGEARDFLDVYGLSQRLGWPRLLELAKQKDAGFSPERLAESLGRIDRLDQAEFGIEKTDNQRWRARYRDPSGRSRSRTLTPVQAGARRHRPEPAAATLQALGPSMAGY